MPESALKIFLRTYRRALLAAYYRRFKSGQTFHARGVAYRYFYHAYNQTYCNERAVEIPLVWPMVQGVPPERVLEVGNVLGHYFATRHDVIDKYEQAPGVQNVDVVEVQPPQPYDLIVAISTLEHVGFHEQPLEPEKPLRAIRHLQRCLSPQGRLVVTMPIGQNPHLDRMLQEGRIPRDDAVCLRRVSRDNRWREVAWEEIRNARYGHPYRNANALVMATFASAALHEAE